MTDGRSFGAWLRRERERRAVTVRAIADRTKIGATLLEALERGDVSRWPGGIYRRAFVRSYAEAIGLDADLVVANFERVFPADPGSAAPAASGPGRPFDRDEPRLSLAAPAVAGVPAAALKKAALDLAVVAGFGLAGLVAAGAVGFWCAAAVSALTVHLMHVLGLERLAGRVFARSGAAPATQPRGEVLSFQAEQVRASSRRARARRVLADLTAAASSASFPGRRRAARS